MGKIFVDFLYIYVVDTNRSLEHGARLGYFFSKKVLIFFLFLYENLCCEALLMSTHSISFHCEIKKLSGYPLLSGAMLKSFWQN